MVHALIFDMDGTMIDSMPSHKRSWAEFAQRQGLEVDISDVMRRTTGRTGIECMRILFGRPDMGEDEAMAHVHVKEAVYRELFSPIFAEVAGFKAFFDHAHARGLKLGVGTAGDRQNQAFAYQHLQMKVAPLTTVGGDEGLAGKPEPAFFNDQSCRDYAAFGRDWLYSQELRNLGRRQDPPQSRWPNHRLIGKAAIANFAKLVGVHSDSLGNGIYMSHGFWCESTGAAVDKRARIRILACLAVVVDKLELGLARVILSKNVPILPKFYSLVERAR